MAAIEQFEDELRSPVRVEGVRVRGCDGNVRVKVDQCTVCEIVEFEFEVVLVFKAIHRAELDEFAFALGVEILCRALRRIESAQCAVDALEGVGRRQRRSWFGVGRRRFDDGAQCADELAFVDVAVER